MEVEWEETGNAQTALDRIKKRSVGHGGRILEETQYAVKVKFGSRVMFQLLGAFVQRGRRYAPLIAEAQVDEVSDGKTSKVRLVTEPHHGWPRVRTAAGESAFRENRDQVVAWFRGS